MKIKYRVVDRDGVPVDTQTYYDRTEADWSRIRRDRRSPESAPHGCQMTVVTWEYV